MGNLIGEVNLQVDREDRRLALAALALVAESCRDPSESLALALDELKQATLKLAQSSESTISTARLMRTTRGLLSIDEQRVRAFHADAHTYLADECGSISDALQLDMALFCVQTILDMRKHISSLPEDPEILMSFLNENPFVAYCIRHWGIFVSPNASPAVLEAVSELLAYYQVDAHFRQLMYLAINHRDVLHLWSGSHQLHVIAWFGLLNIYEHRQQHSPPSVVDVRDSASGKTPLHLACIRGHFELAEKLVEHGAKPASPDALGRTCLWHLVEQNDLRALQVLLDDSCAPAFCAAVNAQNAEEGNLTIMMLAVKNRLYGIIKCLQGVSGFNLDIQDSLGRTALHVAAALNDPTSLELLTKARASYGIRMNLNLRDWSGRSVLHYACSGGTDPALIESLIASGADVNSMDLDGRTPLHVAAAIPSEEVPGLLVMLKQRGADLTTMDSQGLTPYDVASRYDCAWANVLELGQESAAQDHGQGFAILWDKLTLENEDLIRHFKDIETLTEDQIRQKDPLNSSLIHLAVLKTDADVVQALLTDGRMDVNLLDGVGGTALRLAISILSPFEDEGPSPLMGLVRLLLKHNAGLDTIDSQGNSLVQLSFSRGNSKLAMELIAMGAQVALPQMQKQKLLSQAIQDDKPVAVNKLLAAGASLFLYRELTKLPSQTAVGEEVHASEAMRELLQRLERDELERVAVVVD